MEPRNRFRRTDSASLRGLTEGCRTGPPDWESIPGFLKRSTNTSSGVVIITIIEHHLGDIFMQMLFQHDQDRGESLAAPGDRWSLTIGQVITYESVQVIFLLFTCSVADPDPVPFWLRDPGWIKSQDPGSGMTNPDHISWSLETIFWVKILLWGSGIQIGKIWIRDPGARIRVNIPDPQHCFLVQIFQIITW
jgi:hypothetical protein